MPIASSALLTALLSAASPQPIGVMTVIGNSTARACYETAAGGRQPTDDNLESCDAALSAATASAHDLIATRVNRGIVKARRGDDGGALNDFDAALKLNPDQPEALLNKAITIVRRGRGGDAIALFTRALELRTARPELAHYGRAIAHEQSGQVAAAYRDYRRASELKPAWQDPRDELRRFRVVPAGSPRT